ncbi:5427_t:CDS:2, partial [Acaulospora colombiana]
SHPEPVTKPNRRRSSAAKTVKADSSSKASSNKSPNEEKHAASIANAQFQRGLDWESRLFRNLEDSEQLIRLDTSKLKSAQEIRDIILQTAASLESKIVSIKKRGKRKSKQPREKRTVWKPKYIANLEFRSPSFDIELSKHGSGKGSVVFGVAKPDLLKITKVQETKPDGSSEEKIVWEIIDAKVSSELKSSHNAQIGFYHLCVDALLSSVKPDAASRNNAPKIVPSERVSVWIPNGFGQDAVSQGCEFLDNCKASTIADKRLGMIPDLSISDARFIREVLEIADNLGFQSAGKETPIGDIEELDQLVKGPGMKKLESTYPPTSKKFQRLLGIQKKEEGRWSPKLDAAILNRPQRVFTFPRAEDVGIYISLIIDIASSSIGSFCISVHEAQDGCVLMSHIMGNKTNFVSKMARVLKEIKEHNPRSRVQVYTYSHAERSIIMSHLVQVTLTTEQTQEEFERGEDMKQKREDVRMCLGALWEGTSLLVTTFQPSILSGVLLYVLSKKNTLSKSSLETCCERFGLSIEGSMEDMRKRIENEQRRLAEIGGRAGSSADALNRREVGQLPKIVVLKRELERLFALPIPGFIDLPSTGK